MIRNMCKSENSPSFSRQIEKQEDDKMILVLWCAFVVNVGLCHLDSGFNIHPFNIQIADGHRYINFTIKSNFKICTSKV